MYFQKKANKNERKAYIKLRLRHCHLVKFVGKCEKYIYLENCENGNLKQQAGEMDEDNILLSVRQILSFLKYIHEKEFIHNDIKCANILLFENGLVKVCDLGSISHLHNTYFKSSNLVNGTPLFISPESLRNETETKSDIWSLGLCIIEMYTGGLGGVFTGQNSMLLLNSILTISQEDLLQKINNLKLPKTLKEVVLDCLQIDVSQRLSAEQLLLKHFL